MSKKEEKFEILLYYKIVEVENPKNEMRKMLRLCKALDIKGRILVAKDGINGTISGSPESMQVYRDYCDSHKEFNNIDFKSDYTYENPFPRLRVVSREEIVTTGTREKFDLTKRSQHVDIDTFHQWLKDGEDLVILDMRNDYEWNVGRFKGSIRPPMKYFRDLDENLEFYKEYKDKKVVTFCTGGVRCEFATPQLINTGFKPENLYQLEGGIIKYAQKYGDEGFFEGKCFVFDDRITVPVDKSENAVIVGHCWNCDGSTDEFFNCMNAQCNKLLLGCEKCVTKFNKTCSDYCMEVVKDPSKARPERVKVLHRNK